MSDFGAELAAVPAPPKPQSFYDEVPEQSAPWIISQSPIHDPTFLLDENGRAQWQPPSTIARWFYWIARPLPSNLHLQYRAFWERKDEVVRLSAGSGTYSYSQTHTHGTSTAQTSSLAAELGVSAYGVSAKLTETLSRTVTITDQYTKTHTFQTPVPQDKNFVWILWQLVEEFVFLDRDNNVVNYAVEALMLGGSGPRHWTVSLPVSKLQHRKDVTLDITPFGVGSRQPHAE